MNTQTVAQPATQLGSVINELLTTETVYKQVIFVSAFVGLRTILRLRESLLTQKAKGCKLRLVVGIDLLGTSQDVLEELLRWNCEVIVYHNPHTNVTFHPKIYLFESEIGARLIVGSNNLTDGGMFTNYEAAVIHDFAFPSDRNAYNDLYKPLQTFFDPEGPTIQNLTPELISILKLRGLITSEQKARQKNQNINPSDQNKSLPANPFTPVAVPLPPLLPKKVRDEEPVAKTNKSIKPLRAKATNLIPKGLLVWKKKLPKSDALQVSPGTHHVGGVRLTQAHFESPKGHPIDQTTYFRNLFRDFQWELEKGKHADQEHTFVPIHVFIKDKDYGIRHFEISHKPSGEAGQANYTTILRWGSEFTPTIQSENITNLSLYLYDTPSADAPYLIEIK